MMPVLAQFAIPSASMVFDGFAFVGFVLGLIAMFRTAFPARRPPVDVSLAGKADTDAVAALKAEIDSKIDGLTKTITEHYNAIQLSGEKRASGLHKRINRTNAALSRLIGAFSTIHKVEIPNPEEDEP